MKGNEKEWTKKRKCIKENKLRRKMKRGGKSRKKRYEKRNSKKGKINTRT